MTKLISNKTSLYKTSSLPEYPIKQTEHQYNKPHKKHHNKTSYDREQTTHNQERVVNYLQNDNHNQKNNPSQNKVKTIHIIFHIDIDNVHNVHIPFHTHNKTISYETLYQLLDAHYPNLIKKQKTFLKFERYIIYPDQRIHYGDSNTFIEIDVIPKIKGGIFKAILDGILYFFDEIIFNPILYPIKAIFDFFILVFWKVPMYLIKLMIWGVRFISWFLTEVCNPTTLFSDFGTTLKTLIFSIVFAIFELFKSLLKKVVNVLGPTVMNGFWGWDQVKDSEFDQNEAAYFDPNNPHNKRKCYATRNNKVPFSILIGTVVYPPLGVFMEYGLTGWVQIIISAFLTLLFYFPGLIYALICLYC